MDRRRVLTGIDSRTSLGRHGDPARIEERDEGPDETGGLALRETLRFLFLAVVARLLVVLDRRGERGEERDRSRRTMRATSSTGGAQ